jgi:hypothetical protein
MKYLFLALLLSSLSNERAFIVSEVMQSKEPVRGIAGYSKGGRPIEAYYFPGKSDERALIIGGVHGSELSAIEVAKSVIEQLSKDRSNYYSVIVIPCLFPDNTNTASLYPAQIGSMSNIGRYSHSVSADPNRQMPSLGTAFHEHDPVDHAGRTIEAENQLLLKIIQEFRPTRIANLHAIRSGEKAGVYADPRTDSRGYALEYGSDSSIAVGMAMYIEANGGNAPGNKVYKKPTALYHADPVVAPEGQKQKRNLHGSKLPNNRGYGVSLGSWASTAVDDPMDPANNRPAIRLFTIEFPGCKRPEDYGDPAQRKSCRQQIDAYAGAITGIFLDDFYSED